MHSPRSILVASLLIMLLPGVLLAAGTGAEVNGPVESYRWVNEGGPYVGDVYALAVDPSNPHALYAGGLGGLFKSVDGAKTWSSVETYRDRRGLPMRVYDVAIDPSDGNVVYVTSLEGLFKTADGGRSWAVVTMPSSASRHVTAARTEPGVLYASGGGLFKSKDGGLTWESKMKGLRWPPGVPRFDPSFPQTLYAVCGKGVRFQSVDGGKTWRTVRGNIEGISMKNLERDPDNDRGFKVTISFEGDHVFETADGGRSWSPDPRQEIDLYLDTLEIERVESGQVPGMTLQLRDPRHCEIGLTRDGAETWHVIQVPCESWDLRGIRVDPKGRDILYLATEQGVYYYSDDEGKTWEFLYSAAKDPAGEQTETITLLRELFLYGVEDDGRRVRLHDLVVDPSDANVIYHLNGDRGLRKSEDGGRTWVQANHGLALFSTRSIACGSKEAGLVYASGPDGFFRSRDHARSWEQLGSRPYADVIAPHPADAGVILALLLRPKAVSLSVDGGENWRLLEQIPSDQGPVGFLFDSKDADRFYVLTLKGIWETHNRGQTWAQRAVSGDVDYAGFRQVCQTSADIVYLVNSKNQVLKSTDVGTTWHTTPMPDLEDDISSLQVHPADPRHIVLVGRGRTRFRSADAGETREPIQNVGAALITMDPRDPDVFYVVSRPMLRTRDGGKTFENLGNTPGLVAVSPVDGTVYAGTQFSGVYRLQIDEPARKNEAGQ
jgi:photosystem II stability/assembly factor-like uncharacterized protein